MEKTNSQNIARAFEISGYILLVPSFIAVCYSAILFFFGTSDFLIGVFIWTMFFVGCWFLRGYFRHSRGGLSDDSAATLWIATIVYNSIFLLPTLFMLLRRALFEQDGYGANVKSEFEFLFLPMLIWTVAVVAAALALKDVKNIQKYR